jgi:hypothetical protein
MYCITLAICVIHRQCCAVFFTPLTIYIQMSVLIYDLQLHLPSALSTTLYMYITCGIMCTYLANSASTCNSSVEKNFRNMYSVYCTYLYILFLPKLKLFMT